MVDVPKRPHLVALSPFFLRSLKLNWKSRVSDFQMPGAKMKLNNLSLLLSALEVDVDAFAICEIARDAEILIPSLEKVEVHYVLSGRLFLSVGNNAPLKLGPGSVAIVPPRLPQGMAASLKPAHRFHSRSICRPGTGGLELFDAAGDSPVATRVVCGEIHAGLGGFHLFDGIPLPIAANLEKESLIRASFEAMLKETDEDGPFSRSLMSALMKTCLVVLIRHYIAHHGTSGLPGIFKKPWLGLAIREVLTHPDREHSVSSLATISGRSRSVFAKEFHEEIGIPPMTFVARSRLSRACDLLALTNLSVAAIAAQTGFANRSHFSRAFKDSYGIDPSHYKRVHSSAHRGKFH
ncbi:MAG TPA: helix-turn-helix transcriptional regulator [Dongiaceae bacterium]|nr:helix-turn-helix transcriptional regulator [Dongiaceae bacterium]